MAVHSGHTWLATGSIHGRIVTWDLRYRQAISQFNLPYSGSYPVGFTRLQLFDCRRNNSYSTLVSENLLEVQTCKSYLIQ